MLNGAYAEVSGDSQSSVVFMKAAVGIEAQMRAQDSGNNLVDIAQVASDLSDFVSQVEAEAEGARQRLFSIMKGDTR